MSAKSGFRMIRLFARCLLCLSFFRINRRLKNMGAHESKAKSRHRKYDDAIQSFGKEELEKWKESFAKLSGKQPEEKKNGGFSKEQFVEFTKPVLAEQLQQNLMTALVQTESLLTQHHEDKHHRSGDLVTWETFIVGISHFLKSDLDEKTNVLIILCGNTNGNVSRQQFSEFLTNILRIYANVESRTAEYKSWTFPSSIPDELYNSVTDFLIQGLQFDDQNQTSVDALSRWMGSHSFVTRILDLIIYAAFQFDITRDFNDVNYIPWTIPLCENRIQTLLTVPTLVLLNYHVPSEYRHQWRILYSLTKDGESFSTLVKQIIGKGPTLVIVEDEQGYIFGGFNSKNWELSSNFLGDESSFVFSLHPSVAVYTSSGYNKNFCYLNTNQQTLPNGLGFGCRSQDNGQPSDYFTLWLDQNFGTGHSQNACTTFNSPRLSSTDNFKIRSLEVWSVQSTEQAEEKKKAVRSVLDIDPEARAILEMTGKERHSEGLREPKGKDDEG